VPYSNSPLTGDVEPRAEREWPLERTQWTPIHLAPGDTALAGKQPAERAAVTFNAFGESVTFTSAPLKEETELTGPLAATLSFSSSTTDLDLFLTLQAFAPDGCEVEFQGTIDPHTPLAQGWLRASYRKLHLDRSLPHRPCHSHDEQQRLEPGVVYRVAVEIWPACVVLPAGYRPALQISGRDFEREPPDDPNEAWVSCGSGP
jgi:predicted acyl esterase